MTAKQNKAPNHKYAVIDYDNRELTYFDTVEQLTTFFKDFVDGAGIKQEEVQLILEDEFLVLDQNLERVVMTYACRTEIVVHEVKEARSAVASKTRKK